MSNKTNLGKNRKTDWTLKEALEANLPDIQWLIKDILPQGFFFLAGRPKIGKSFMTLQMCISIVTGQKFLGYDVMQQGRVLYISLEDNIRRIVKRAKNIGLISDDKNLNMLEIVETWEPLNKGGLVKLLDRLNKKKYVLCVIDTYAKAFLMKDNNDAVEATKCLKPLYEMTRGGDFTFQFVDHHRKNNQYSGDVIDDLAGSGAKGGVADTVWSLRRERGKSDAFLEIASRDTDIDKIDLKFDPDRTWWVPKEYEVVKPGTIQAKIVAYFGNNGERAHLTQISKSLGYEPSNVSREMVELIKKQVLVKGERIGRNVFYMLNKDKRNI